MEVPFTTSVRVPTVEHLVVSPSGGAKGGATTGMTGVVRHDHDCGDGAPPSASPVGRSSAKLLRTYENNAALIPSNRVRAPMPPV
jgi:hypothetical protein